MTTLSNTEAKSDFYPELLEYVARRIAEFDRIENDRKKELENLAGYVRNRLDHSLPAKLIFICTHNSRRSHLSQIWAQVAAEYYGKSGVETFSGGTEATAMNPRAVAALKRCGLKITAQDPKSSNPKYEVRSSDSAKVQVCFSKKYDSPPNPTSEYCAVMTCSQADDACPIVSGCDMRIPIRYEDPKVADDTDQESERYDERSAQICREMFYMMSKV